MTLINGELDKMAEIFLISDTHFGHKGVTIFTNDDGSPLRPWDCPDEMDEAMVENWNSVVKPEDKVYHLGDVVINRKALQTVKRLNGKKRLVRGNHDIFKTREYLDVGFKEIHGIRVFVDRMVLTHVPIHPDCLTERWSKNVHGHLHGRKIMIDETIPLNQGESMVIGKVPDPRYVNVSVEQINYTPIHIEEIRDNAG